MSLKHTSQITELKQELERLKHRVWELEGIVLLHKESIDELSAPKVRVKKARKKESPIALRG